MSATLNVSTVKSLSEGTHSKDEQDKPRGPQSQEAELQLVENRKALGSANEYVRKHGLALERYRLF